MQNTCREGSTPRSGHIDAQVIDRQVSPNSVEHTDTLLFS